MREIKFRGKSIRTGQWVYGGYHKHINRTPCPIGDEVFPEDVSYCIIVDGFSDWNMPRSIDAHPVDPETIGQYTGLKDKNGTEIYEGDKLERTGTFKDGVVSYKDGGYVVWSDSGYDLKFTYETDYHHGEPYRTREKESNVYLSMFNTSFEVIGNIYENPM